MPTELDIDYAPGPVSTKFHHDRTSRVKLLIGPFGTGKTTSAAWDEIDFQSEQVRPLNGRKKSRFVIVRNTYPQLKDTVIATVLDWFPPAAFGRYNMTEKIYSMKIEDRDIELYFRALDIEKDVRNLLSLEVTGGWCDEAREIKQDIVKGLLGRIGRYPSIKDFAGQNPFTSPPQLLLTTNYPSTEHWIYKDFIEKPIDGYTIYEQTQEENKRNLRPGYYDDLEKDYADRPDLLKTLVRGSWGVTVRGKIVYPEFRRPVHVAKSSIQPSEKATIIVGWDNTGLSPAINLSYISALGQWRVFKEFCFEDTGIADATEAFIIWSSTNLHPECTFKHYGDPAGKNRDATKKSPAIYISETAKNYGKAIDIEDGIQTFKIRREAVAARLTKMINGEPAMLVDPSCTRVIDGFEGGYSYPEIANSSVFKDEPAKNEYSHIHDSLQYPATKLFRIAVQEEKPDKWGPRQRVL